jgi:hypothetical protein
LSWKGVYFSTFVKVLAIQNIYHSAQIAPESGGELIFGDGPFDPYPARHEAVLEQLKASQLLLHSWTEKKVCVAISGE